VSVVSATQEAEAAGSLSSGLQGQPGNIARPHLLVAQKRESDGITIKKLTLELKLMLNLGVFSMLQSGFGMIPRVPCVKGSEPRVVLLGDCAIGRGGA
jgi:hypothetical protein